MKSFPRTLWKTCALGSFGLLLVTAAPALAQSKLANPFSGATMYVNPDYTAKANAEAASQSGTLAAAMRTVGQQPQAVWMDRIAAVPSLATHLDATLAQGKNLFLGVVYDLPGRDCAALASNGELPGTAEGLARYKTEYIDPIVATVSQSKYANLRIVFVVEPDSLPNLVTNLSDPECAQMESQGIYAQGIQYAVNQLAARPNVYLYLDAGHSGWLGWPNNFDGWINKMNTISSGFTGGKGAIHGFVDDTANTLPTEEPFIDDNTTVGGRPVRESTFYDWNPYVEERTFAIAMQQRFASAGWTGVGMLIDTSRNGWGGSQRPTAASTSTDLNTWVNASKVDRRAHRGLWCNPLGAGIGALPTASTGIANVDAFVWVKPPGESDGASRDIPNDQGKRFDRMCDPTYTTQYGVLTGATPDAPLSGDWFSAQFRTLVANAYPAIGGGGGTTNTLTVTRAGAGTGTVTSSPSGINCGTTCSASFSSTSTVTLTASPASGSTFGSWSGCTGSSGATCTVSMSQARSVTATFNGGGGGGGTTCANPITFTGNTNNFNTTGAVCYRTTAATINGWGCYNFDGRTVTVGGQARTCGQMPLTRSADGYYFSVTAGQFPWAGIYTW